MFLLWRKKLLTPIQSLTMDEAEMLHNLYCVAHINCYNDISVTAHRYLY